MLRRYCTKGHAHNRIGAGGEDIHFAVLKQFTLRVTDVVGKGKTHAVAFAYPILLHEFDALRPAKSV